MSDAQYPVELIEDLIHDAILAPKGTSDHDEAYSVELKLFRGDPGEYLLANAEMIIDSLEKRYPGLKPTETTGEVPDNIWTFVKQLDAILREKDQQRDQFNADLLNEIQKASLKEKK